MRCPFCENNDNSTRCARNSPSKLRRLAFPFHLCAWRMRNRRHDTISPALPASTSSLDPPFNISARIAEIKADLDDYDGGHDYKALRAMLHLYEHGMHPTMDKPWIFVDGKLQFVMPNYYNMFLSRPMHRLCVEVCVH